jgi:hypothetical protein
MKTCFKCGVPKELKEFYKHPQMADGHLSKCIECAKADVLRHRAANLDAVQAYDRERGKLPHRLANVRAYHKAHPDKIAKYHRKTWEKYPERRNAAVAVGNAVRDGRLMKQPCEVCGATKVEAHHDDYTKPLEVRWLCNPHHKIADAARRLRE